MTAARLPWKELAWAGAMTLAAFLAYFALGTVNVTPGALLHALVSGDTGGSDTDNLIVWRIRLPRAVACACVGGLLGTVGSAFQALFRNALAEPYVIGVSSGAAVGGTFAVLLGIDAGLSRVGFAFVGAFLSLLLVLGLARRQGGVNVQTLLVGGVVVGTLLSGLTTLNLTLAGFDSGKVLFWLLGSTNPMFWDKVAVLVVVLVAGGLVLLRQSRALNAFSVSEFMAERQGVDAGKLKWTVLVTSSAMTGVAVGTVGIVGFVGLVAPHIARRIVGNDVRRVMPLSAFFGSTLLLVADILAQRLREGAEIPLGAVTAVLGAPALLWLLKQKG